jgi:hypothetical protein
LSQIRARSTNSSDTSGPYRSLQNGSRTINMEVTMKRKSMLLGTTVAVVLAAATLGLGATAQAHGWGYGPGYYGHMGYGGGWGSMGPGMMGGYGPGWMHSYGPGYRHVPWGRGYRGGYSGVNGPGWGGYGCGTW